jgi:galactose mutarotase-like enzyme
MIDERKVDGFEAIALSAPEHGIEAVFVPEAGMVGGSLTHGGRELLGQRGGLARYAAKRSTMGIPLLHPWANRLAARHFEVAGGEVNLDQADPAPATDPNGLPIHGLLSAAPGWWVAHREATDDGGVLRARFDFAANAGLLRAFPFPHELSVEATLAGRTLTITTTVEATGEGRVPISFGYHPYFKLPGADRSNWRVELPVRERLPLDERMLPTGRREPIEIESGALGSRTFDDAFTAPPAGARFAVAGGGTRIEVAFDPGYPYAQVYAPDDDDVIALEPMTAPTNALVTGGSALPIIGPGESFGASFSVTVLED